MARQFLTAVNEETLVMDMVTARASLGVFNWKTIVHWEGPGLVGVAGVEVGLAVGLAVVQRKNGQQMFQFKRMVK